MQIPRKIGPFNRFLRKKTTMKYGFYYDCVFNLPFHKDKRHIRVWLPEDYDFDNEEKRFPAIYFSDGQNLVDRYLSAYGEWELDKTAHKMLNEGIQSFIAVGIDCPVDPIDRANELNPPYKVTNLKSQRYVNKPCANKYVDYICNKLKPLIDELFFTDKDNTGIGGSSMGGIMAFYAYIYRPDVFNFSLSFSPAFFHYSKKEWFRILDTFDINDERNGKIFFYVGGTEFERIFTKSTFYTYEYMLHRGIDTKKIGFIFDKLEIHHESAWAKYLKDALTLWLK